MKSIYFNEDNHHFYLHPASDMTPEGCRRLVDYYASPGTIKGIMFCTNVQRALYDSEVWERFSEINYDNPLMTNLKLLSERKVDQFKEWLQRCRELGIEGHLSVRMNDCHGLEESIRRPDSWCANWPTEYWKNNPQLRRAPYRFERSWEGAFNYMLPEVREHIKKLIAELLERYDMDGIELDWMRWAMMVPPGFEHEAQPVLTRLVRDIRSMMDAAEKRLGHKIMLSHRIPETPQGALDFGFDAVTWAREGMADMLTLSEFLDAAICDAQVKLWRMLLPETTVINVYIEESAHSYPGCGVHCYDLMRGTAAGAWSCGADNIYMFNACYLEQNDPELLTSLLTETASSEALFNSRRQIPVGFSQARIPGTSLGNVLPLPLRQAASGTDLTRMDMNITLRLNAGKTAKTDNIYLRLCFSGVSSETCGQLERMPIRVNTSLLDAPVPCPVYTAPGKSAYPYIPAQTEFTLCCKVPREFLHETFNAVEFEPPQTDGQLIWCDLLIMP